MKDTCGCCAGIEALTPLTIRNRPGLDQLAYRVGTHGTFLVTMKAQLSQPMLSGEEGHPGRPQLHPLEGLTTRAPDDPAIAFLDAWATIADVLTFYQERIANEGYLRTATERRSVLELGRLVGYVPRPGVAASVLLAYTLEEGQDVTIPVGSRAQSLPGPGELPAVFETALPLPARASLNRLRPRLTQPQNITPNNVQNIPHLYLKGTGLNLQPNDLLLFTFAAETGPPVLRRVQEVEIDFKKERTRVLLQADALFPGEFIRQIRPAPTILGAAPPSGAPGSIPLLERVRPVLERLRDELTFDRSLEKLEERVLRELQDPDWRSLKEELDKFAGKYEDLARQVRLLIRNLDDLWGDPGTRDRLASTDFQSVLDAQRDAETQVGQVVTALGPEKLPEGASSDDLKARIKAARDVFQPIIAAGPRFPAFLAALEALQTALNDAAGNADPDLPTGISQFNNARQQVFLTQLHQPSIADRIEEVLKELEGVRDNPPANVKVRVQQEIQKLLAIVNAATGRRITWTRDLAERINQLLLEPIAQTKEAHGRFAAALDALLVGVPDPPDDAFLRDRVGRYQTAANPLATIATGTGAGTVETVKTNLQNQEREELPGRTITGVATTIGQYLKAVSQARQQIRRALKTALEVVREQYRFLEAGAAGSPMRRAWDLLEPLPGKVPVEEPADTPITLASLAQEIETARQGVIVVQQEAPPDAADLESKLQALVGELQRLHARITVAAQVPPPEFQLDPEAPLAGLVTVGDLLAKGAPAQPGDPSSVRRDLGDLRPDATRPTSDAFGKLLQAFSPSLEDHLYAAWRKASVASLQEPSVYVFRQQATLFGYNAQKRFTYIGDTSRLNSPDQWAEWNQEADEETGLMFLDREYRGVVPNSYMTVFGIEPAPKVVQAAEVDFPARSAYGISGKATRVRLAGGETWRQSAADISPLRRAVVYAESERLPLAEEPIEELVGPLPGAEPAAGGAAPAAREVSEIELDDLYEGLEPGGRVVLVGERADLPGAVVREAAVIRSVAHVLSARPGDTPHTRLTLDGKLSNAYRREQVTIYGNVVEATHGETQTEVLGSGDGSQSFQSFLLHKSPLTYLPSPTPSGVQSTLEVRVNDILWHEAESLSGLGPEDRSFITQTSDDGTTQVVFGSGKRGARLPSGAENVRAVYRAGIGKGGNVRAEQVSQLTTRPLGVKEVINPLRASGGADREEREQIRRGIPLVTTALDRLVSVQDYGDFARTFAGIGKARAVLLPAAPRPVISLTIAGADDAPIDPGSALYRHLVQALQRFGDPQQPVRVEIRELLLLAISAGLRLHPDYLWDVVVEAVRAALREAFSFQQRELGQDVTLSEVVSVIQGVAGVEFVDLDVLDGIREQDIAAEPRSDFLSGPKQRVVAQVTSPSYRKPAQLLILRPDPSDTLVLKRI